MSTRSVCWALIGTTVTLLSCSAQPFTILRASGNSAIEVHDPTLLVADNEGELDAIHQRMTANFLPKQIAPRVDFNANIVLYLSSGKKPTSGHGLAVAGANCRAKVMQVSVVVAQPDPKIIQAQMATMPALLVALGRCADMKAIEVNGLGEKLRYDLPSR